MSCQPYPLHRISFRTKKWNLNCHAIAYRPWPIEMWLSQYFDSSVLCIFARRQKKSLPIFTRSVNFRHIELYRINAFDGKLLSSQFEPIHTEPNKCALGAICYHHNIACFTLSIIISVAIFCPCRSRMMEKEVCMNCSILYSRCFAREHQRYSSAVVCAVSCVDVDDKLLTVLMIFH